MQKPGAQQILQSLVQGVDPHSGDELPPETVLQRAEVIRALLAGINALEAGAARAVRRASLPENVGRPWSDEEERDLTAAFRRGEAPDLIAVRHGRTLTAIEARLEKMGLVRAEERTTRNRFISDRSSGRPSKTEDDD